MYKSTSNKIVLITIKRYPPTFTRAVLYLEILIPMYKRITKPRIPMIFNKSD